MDFFAVLVSSSDLMVTGCRCYWNLINVLSESLWSYYLTDKTINIHQEGQIESEAYLLVA